MNSGVKRQQQSCKAKIPDRCVNDITVAAVIARIRFGKLNNLYLHQTATASTHCRCWTFADQRISIEVNDLLWFINCIIYIAFVLQLFTPNGVSTNGRTSSVVISLWFAIRWISVEFTDWQRFKRLNELDQIDGVCNKNCRKLITKPIWSCLNRIEFC